MQEFLTPSSSPSSNTLDKIEGKKKKNSEYLFGFESQKTGSCVVNIQKGTQTFPTSQLCGQFDETVGVRLNHSMETKP